MTVKELIDVSFDCDLVEVVVREEGFGKWIQGYRIGKNAELFPVEITKEVLEKYKLEQGRRRVIPLEEDQEIDCMHAINLPMKVICKDVKKMPDYIGNLKISYVIPRKVPVLHKGVMVNNDHAYDITCYPDGYVEPVEEQKQEKDLEGQIEWRLQ